MSFLSRLFGKHRNERDALRPLWYRVVEIAREKPWYAECGVTDTIDGRFDTIAMVLSLVLLRMEREESLVGPSARLTEVFVEDMDGQLRQEGIGDLVVGKHVGKLMKALGGRLGAFREALPKGKAELMAVLDRNMNLHAEANVALLAERVLALAAQLETVSADDLLTARIER